MTLFALLHGGMHRGSCWDAVSAELGRRGHTVVAPDLPVDDEDAGARDWAEVAIGSIRAAVQNTGEDVVVVGHSIAGLCVPVVAASFPIARMVFVGGLLPAPGESFAEHLAQNPDAISFPAPQTGGSGPFGLTWESVRDGFYHDCPPDIARRAFDGLRGQAFTVFVETCPLAAWPDVSSTYILMRDDRAVGAAWARRNAIGRIGADVVEIDGGHSPFYSRPFDLSDVLESAAEG